MKKHLGVLYSAIIILISLQLLSFLSISSQVSKIILEQEKIKNNFENSMEELRTETQFNIRELVDVISQQKTDFENEIELLKDTKQDFSRVIENTIRGVVNVVTERASGSGFLIEQNGYLITNAHVISESLIIKVQTFDGKIYDAKVIGTNSEVDIAVLKIEGSFQKLEFADSNKVQIGEKVIAIGNPLGLSFTVTEGIVSATKRTGPNSLSAYIQTDVTLNPGNSGGPLINKEGKVIGINNFKVGGAESLGFALESNVAKKEIELMTNSLVQLNA
jgi:S1-C subfamily serine protease